jgi:hypothetical protein
MVARSADGAIAADHTLHPVARADMMTRTAHERNGRNALNPPGQEMSDTHFGLVTFGQQSVEKGG